MPKIQLSCDCSPAFAPDEEKEHSLSRAGRKVSLAVPVISVSWDMLK